VSEEGEPRATRLAKRASAFRTIGEVAEDLALPAHVLRFWEAKFSQLKPLKRGGGRRYYRPEDIALLRRIRECLYDEGYTIRGVQKLLAELSGGAPVPEPPPAMPSLFPLDAASEPRSEGSREPALPRRSRRRTPQSPEADDADRRAALEAVRRDLQAARALIDDLLQQGEEDRAAMPPAPTGVTRE
jgi:DNA-binding transcriptional MerR regulator